jgi:hypothetical protein
MGPSIIISDFALRARAEVNALSHTPRRSFSVSAEKEAKRLTPRSFLHDYQSTIAKIDHFCGTHLLKRTQTVLEMISLSMLAW